MKDNKYNRGPVRYNLDTTTPKRDQHGDWVPYSAWVNLSQRLKRLQKETESHNGNTTEVKVEYKPNNKKSEKLEVAKIKVTLRDGKAKNFVAESIHHKAFSVTGSYNGRSSLVLADDGSGWYLTDSMGAHSCSWEVVR